MVDKGIVRKKNEFLLREVRGTVCTNHPERLSYRRTQVMYQLGGTCFERYGGGGRKHSALRPLSNLPSNSRDNLRHKLFYMGSVLNSIENYMYFIFRQYSKQKGTNTQLQITVYDTDELVQER